MRWVSSEQEAKSRLRLRLRESLSLARASHTLVEESIEVLKARPPDLPAQVQVRILVRMSNDVRVVEIASFSGYSQQALGLAATVYELAAAFAFIGTNEERAQKWQQHSDWRNSYPGTSSRPAGMRSLLRELGVPNADLDVRTDQHERVYKFLCMAKHGNPEMLRKYGAKVEPRRLRLYHGPVIGPALVWQAKFVLFHTVKLLATCAYLLVKCRRDTLSESRVKPFLRRAWPVVNRLMEAGRNVDLALKPTGAG